MYFVDMMLVLMLGIQCHNTSFLKNKKDMMLKCHQKIAKDDVVIILYLLFHVKALKELLFVSN